MMRLFIALELPIAIQQTLANTQKQLQNKGVQGRLIPQNQLHCTLAFIGETNQAKQIQTILETTATPKETLCLTTLGHFKNLIYQNLEVPVTFCEYVNTLKTKLAQQGIKTDPKPFKPHITLVRNANTTHITLPTPKLCFQNYTIVLYQSQFTKKGVEYHALWKASK